MFDLSSCEQPHKGTELHDISQREEMSQLDLDYVIIIHGIDKIVHSSVVYNAI